MSGVVLALMGVMGVQEDDMSGPYLPNEGSYRLVVFCIVPHLRGASNEPRCNPQGALVVLLRAGLRLCALSSSFRLRLGLPSTSVSVDLIP